MTALHYQFNTDTQIDEFMLIHKHRCAAFGLQPMKSSTQKFSELTKQLNKAFNELGIE
jgi:hypothetical protein